MIYVLSGGRSKDSKEINIEKEVFKLVGKTKINILFCPLAQINNTDKCIERFNEYMKDLNYDAKYLIMDNLNQFDDLFNWCDIFYVYGGVCDTLVKIFKEYKLDLILKKYDDSNKIYYGISAGAMLPTVTSLGDKDMFSDNFHNYNYKMVNCLGILNISICPHYQNEDLIIYNDIIKKYNLHSFGIEEDCALVIDGTKYYVFKDYKYKSLYEFDKNYKMIPLYEGVKYEKNSGFRS
ncbi:MAG: Type 1 glutamine amidotransferase-like domain-containing protein [Acholeplasmatales bacterium]|nr:Type 1 glutamine amidotransferase-like domain-containing protein [Acholeplasmatales bacterium]